MYTLRGYGAMIADAGRTGAYDAALRATVSEDSVVLDIGTGTGIFALLACRYGARKVYAIESDPVIAVAREIARANGFADRIEFIHGRSNAARLPERATVVVSDLHGVLPYFHGHIETIIDVRERLMAPSATLIPRRDFIRAAIVSVPKEHERIVSSWSYRAFGFDMGAARALAAHTLERTTFEASQLVSANATLGEIDFHSVTDARFLAEAELRAERRAVCHGVGAWFDSELAEGVSFTNDPKLGGHVYGQGLFPWPEPVELDAEDIVRLRLRADPVGGEYLWSWRTSICGASGAEKARFDQSEFFAEALSPEDLRRRSASHVPRFTEEAEIDATILAGMREGLASGEIARRLADRFCDRFPRWQDALARVGRLARRYGD